jgi:hypothetical protein
MWNLKRNKTKVLHILLTKNILNFRVDIICFHPKLKNCGAHIFITTNNIALVARSS